jgi:hypothetical protein
MIELGDFCCKRCAHQKLGKAQLEIESQRRAKGVQPHDEEVDRFLASTRPLPAIMVTKALPPPPLFCSIP